VQLAAQRLGQIPSLIGAVGIQKITLVAHGLASFWRLVDVGKNVLAVSRQRNKAGKNIGVDS
jgi:hypothetical protein